MLQTEVLILAEAIENHIALAETKVWGDLRHTSHMHFEVAEHFVRLPGNCVTGDTGRFSEEKQCAPFLSEIHGFGLASRKLINRSIGED